MKLKLIALAAMLAAGSANASIVDGSTGNGELFMTVLDSAGLKSYTLDLNLTMNDFLAGIAVSGTSYSFAADANMTSFLSTVADPTSLTFAIGAMDATGTSTTDYHRYITTASVIDLGSTVTNAVLKNMGSQGAIFVGDNNSLMGAANSVIVTDTATSGYAGNDGTWGSNWGTAFNGVSTGLTDTDEIVEATDLGMYFLRQSSGAFTPRNNPSIYAAIMQGGNQVYANLSTSGNLTIAAAPVPEAETYAMMLAGLGLVGFMVARRRQA